MEEEFLNYDQALALKELGFNEPCFKGYTEEYKTLINFSNTHTNTSVKNTLPTKPFTAPLYQQAFKWFRDEYKLWFRPDYYDEIRDYFTGSIHKLGRFSALYNLENYATAEECESACIDELIEMAKNEKTTNSKN